LQIKKLEIIPKFLLYGLAAAWWKIDGELAHFGAFPAVRFRAKFDKS
jgi:hypothetical protein